MKKKILITASIFASLAILAQNKINFHTIFNTKTFNISEIDTIRFSDGYINIEGSVSESISVAEVDSATFTLTNSDTYGDTVFVTFDGDDAMVQNPYSNISVTTDGANVSINSAADIKGVVYYLSGSSDNGSFSITPDRAFTLVLDNLSLSCSNAPIVLNLGEDGESYAATVNMRGASTLKDGEASAYKGAMFSKSKLKFYDEINGSLEIYGNTKHAINGSKHVEIYGGKIIVKSAIGDGLNADGLEMYGGLLSALDFAGDGVQCSESIRIEDGKIEIVSSADDAKGLKADSSIVINGGSIDINMSGAAAKGIKSALQPIEINGGKTYIQTSGNALIASDDSSFATGLKSDSEVIINGGEIILECSGENGKCIAADQNIIVSGGNVANIVNGNGAKGLRAKQNILISGGTVSSTLSASMPYIGTGNDHSYNSAMNADGNIQISGDANVSVSGDGIAAKALKCDGNAHISGGEFTADLTGAHFIESVNSDTSSVFAIKSDKDVLISGGKTNIEIANAAYMSKAIKADGNVSISAGEVYVSNNGKYFYTATTSSNGSSSSNRPGGFGPGSSSTTVDVNSSGSHAISANGNVSITGGTIDLAAYYGKSITCDGDVTIGTTGGNNDSLSLTLTAGCEGTSSDYTTSNSRRKYYSSPKGIKADGTININSGKINVKSYNTGLKAPTVNINGGDIEVWASYDQGIHGVNALTFNGGNTRVTASYEGVSGVTITFNGGSTYIVSSDDGWNASTGSSGTVSGTPKIYVKGGYHYVQASGDGLDSNGSMEVSGGVTVCCQSGNGNSALDTNNGYTHTGGYVLGIGSNGMFNESVPSSSVSHIYSTSISVSANNFFIVADANGKVLSALKMPVSATAAVCAYSSDISGYKFYTGSTFDGTLNLFDGRFAIYETDAPSISAGNYKSYTVSTGAASGGMGGWGW